MILLFYEFWTNQKRTFGTFTLKGYLVFTTVRKEKLDYFILHNDRNTGLPPHSTTGQTQASRVTETIMMETTD